MTDTRRSNILLVDDRPENLLALEAILKPLGQNLVRATSGAEALRCLLNDDFAVILLDVQMPELDGWETAEHIKRRSRTRDIPIIFLSAISRDLHHQLRGYATGAVDYLSKPFEPEVLRSKVAVFLELHEKNELLKDQARMLRRRLEERDRAQEALARQAAALERSNADLEQFCYVASHDLQAPLNTVAGFLELVTHRAQGKLDEETQFLIARACEGVARMQSLITDLLAYSRVGTAPEPLGPAESEEAFARALSDLQAALDEAAAVVSHGPLPVVQGDPWQLTQLFENLLNNAVKFRGAEPPRVHVDAEARDGEWLFTVQDNGIGIDPRQANRVFTLFQRLHSQAEYPGTGIGLSICKKIVERHGGRIWFDSEPGRGTAFRFTLPAAPDRDETGAPGAEGPG